MESTEPADKPRLTIPLLWTGFAVLTAVAACAGVGFSASGSESAGVTATGMAAPVVGFAIAGAIGSVVVHFVGGRASLGRILAPFGCGCVGAVVLALVSLVFFAVVFPAL